MKTFDITALERKEISKKSNNLLRNQAQVPCVVYGEGQHHHVSIPMRLFREIAYTKYKYFINLKIGAKAVKCILQEVQFHPVSNMILHADFFILDEKKEVRMRTPINYTGTPAGVTKGGRMVPHLRSLLVKALPKDIPESVEVEVSTLDVGEKLRVRDLASDRFAILEVPAALLVSVEKPRVMKKEAEVTEAAPEKEDAEEKP